MKISVIGAGPGGLYFSILTKKRMPDCVIDIYEQNKNDDAFGFGVVFSDETLSEFLSYDMASYELIRTSFAYWDNIDIVRNGEKVTIKGNGFCGCSRKTLLLLLQQRCKEEGINMHFQTKINELSELKDSDLIVAADGINSEVRTSLQEEFGTSIQMKTNRFLWCGSSKPLDAFTYFFKTTPYGTFCAHTYQYEKGHSTWIFECSNETYLNAGFSVTAEKESIEKLEKIFEDELQGYALNSNRSYWRQFPHVENKNWFYKNIVLLGDAKATAHYSIGSGTKLAMECAIALSDAVVQNPKSIADALQQYDNVRRTPVEVIQHAATVSLQWFEAMDRHIKLDFDTFSFSLMSRSKKITIENQSLRDGDYAKHIIASFNKKQNSLTSHCSPAFTPFKIGNLSLKNRIVMSAMGQYNAQDGLPSDWHFVHYTSRAIGGVGLIITEMTAIAPDARITPYCTGIWNDEQALAWKKIVDFIHKNTDTKIGIQLGHSGRKGNFESIKNGKMIPLKSFESNGLSASPIPYATDFPTPKEMDEADMEKVINDFTMAAKRAVNAGFDLLELQAHHGFLLASFISPLTNKRTDAYGGTIENRMKFPLKVLKSIKEITKNSVAISVRISATDWAEGGITEEDICIVANEFMKNGADIINVSTGNTVIDQKPIIGRMWQTPFSEMIKNTLNIPTITTGYIQNIDQINTCILNQRADLVALGRPLLLDPYFVRNAQAYENQIDILKIPDPYLSASLPLLSMKQKERTELETMKIKLKPKSHQ